VANGSSPSWNGGQARRDISAATTTTARLPKAEHPGRPQGKHWALGKALAIWVILTAAAVPAATPLETVEGAVTSVVSILRSPDVAGRPGRPAAGTTAADRRAAQIRQLAERLFDVDEVAHRALWRHWAARTPAERAEFVRLFKTLLERTYIGKIESYSGQKIIFVGQRVDGNTATVMSRIVSEKARDATSLDYRLHVKAGRWQVYDLLIDGVSFVASYRSQFDRLIRQSSYDAVVQQLRESMDGQGEAVSASPSARTGRQSRPHAPQ
jgi:phospholipid transport system substrate-binding protein